MALYKSPLTIDGEVTTEECVMSHMTKHGVKYVQIYGVDNAIVRVGEERDNGMNWLVSSSSRPGFMAIPTTAYSHFYLSHHSRCQIP